MKFTEAVVEIRQMQESDLPRQAIVAWLEQQDVSTTTAYRWVAKANQEDENGLTPQQQALEAMLDIMRARQGAGDDAGVLEVAAKIAKCK
nr:hypothetical protein 43 [bacterium]